MSRPLPYVLIVMVLSSVWAVSDAAAWWNAKKSRPIDQNKNGKIEAPEAARAQKLQQKSKVDQKWEQKADVNADGRVEPAEVRWYNRKIIDVDGDGRISLEERSSWWISRKAKVNTPAEARWDLNHNGVIEGEEARGMMHSRLLIIQTEGKAKVNTDIERAFDLNRDGFIDSQEAPALKEALGEK